jgi:hypothetical protein
VTWLMEGEFDSWCVAKGILFFLRNKACWMTLMQSRHIPSTLLFIYVCKIPGFICRVFRAWIPQEFDSHSYYLSIFINIPRFGTYIILLASPRFNSRIKLFFLLLNSIRRSKSYSLLSPSVWNYLYICFGRHFLYFYLNFHVF